MYWLYGLPVLVQLPHFVQNISKHLSKQVASDCNVKFFTESFVVEKFLVVCITVEIIVFVAVSFGVVKYRVYTNFSFNPFMEVLTVKLFKCCIESAPWIPVPSGMGGNGAHLPFLYVSPSFL